MAKKKRDRVNRNRKRAVIYIRYSSHNQSDGYSIEYQLEQAKAYAERHGLTIVGEYIDTAKTAKETTGRGELQRMLDDAEKDMFDSIIVFSFNRAFRNTRDALNVHFDLMEKFDIPIQSVIEPIDMGTPHGKFSATNLFAMHELSSDIIAAHVTAAMYYAVQQGYYIGGAVPIGYTLVGTGEYNKGRERKRFAICPKYGPLVKEIFELYLSGIGPTAIAKLLFNRGELKPNGKPFDMSIITRILHSERYIGNINYKFKGYEPITLQNAVPAIIDGETYSKVLARQKHASRNPRYTGTNYIFNFTGKIFCSKCGSRCYSGSATRENASYRYRYYGCKSKRSYDRNPCGNPNINARNLDAHIMSAIQHNILNQDAIDHISGEIARIAKEKEKESKTDTAPLEKRKKELIKALKSLIDDKAFGKMPESLIDEKTEEYTSELNSIETSLRRAENADKKITKTDVKKFLNDILNEYDKSIESAKMIFDTFVNKVEYNRKHVEVELIIPSTPFYTYKGSFALPSEPLYVIPIIIDL